MPSFTTYNSTGMENRSVSAGVYRFGFQGQEKDPDWTGQQGSHINYKYRVHDTRIGRFLSIDPLTAKYPHNSPYAFSENRVIDAVELEGKEAMLLRPIGMNNTNMLIENSQKVELRNPNAGNVKKAVIAGYLTTTNNPHSEAFDALPPRVKAGVKGTSQVVFGGCGTIGGLAITGGSGLLAAPTGTAAALASWSTAVKGFQNIGYAIEGEPEEEMPKGKTMAYNIAEKVGADEGTAEKIDASISLASGIPTKPIDNKFVDNINRLSLLFNIGNAEKVIGGNNNDVENDFNNTDKESIPTENQQFLDKDVKNQY